MIPEIKTVNINIYFISFFTHEYTLTQ